ncbi:hypothetical protein RS030_162490 [Cryptosporidium xiaoi]|uniref:AP-5 complex subunit beta-1 n=1 Tax=Cryptosporidium xiaoi TaxID=659607 RepID=A0AAV9Y0Q0_9CRYT
MEIIESDRILNMDNFSYCNTISLLRYNLNNNDGIKNKVLDYIYDKIEERMSLRYLNVQKEINGKLSKMKNEVKHGFDSMNDSNKSKNMLFDHIMSTLIISDKLETKLDVLTLLEEQYETIIGDPGSILSDKSCWNRYNTVFNIFESIATLNYYRLAKEAMNLYEASTKISENNMISVDNIHESLTKNKKYQISILIQSQTLIAFTSIAVNVNLIELIPYWFSKLISILFIISKEEYIVPQKVNEKNIVIYQNYFYIKKYANECLNELNRNYPLLFNNLLNSNVILNNAQVKLSKKDMVIINYIGSNISKNIWPNSLEKHFISELNGIYNNTSGKSTFSDNLSIELIISIISSIISVLNDDEKLVTKLIKEKEKFLTYLVTYIMEDLSSTSTWNLHKRILFLKNIMKTLSIPPNVLESSLLPLFYSSKIHILFEISLFIIEEISSDLFNNSYHNIIGIINNYLMPNNIRIYSTLWLQLLINNYKSNFNLNNNINNTVEIIDKIIIPKWYDPSSLKYSKFLLLIQLKLNGIINSDENEFYGILHESLFTLSEYLIIKAPIGSHSVYLKLLFKISLLFGMETFIVDHIFKYSSSSNYLISSTHIPNTIKLINLITVHSKNKKNYEQIIFLIYNLINHIKSLKDPKEINPFLLFLLYLSLEHKLFSKFGDSFLITDVINTLLYITQVFLERIHQPTMRWIYINKIYSVCIKIMINNASSFEIKYLLNKLIKYIKSLIKMSDTQILDCMIEIENSINNTGINSIKHFYESENNVESSLDSFKDLYYRNNTNNSSNNCENNGFDSTQDAMLDKYNIELVKCKHFRKKIYNLFDDDSFSIYSDTDDNSNIITLPFQLIFNNKDENIKFEKICIYALKFDFKSSNNSLEIKTIHMPFLKSQQDETTGMEQENNIKYYINSNNTEILKISDNQIFLFIKAKVNHPCPCLIQVNLIFNDEYGSIHNIELDEVYISFQDLFIPLMNDKISPKYRYYEINGEIKDSEYLNYSDSMINSCRVLDLSSKLILECINKYILIFEVDYHKLDKLFKNKFKTFEDFDFKHDFLMNKRELSTLDQYTYEEIGDVKVTYRWFYIHLFPKYHLIFQFSITDNVSIIRIYTDLYDILAHCDKLFDLWLDENNIN